MDSSPFLGVPANEWVAQNRSGFAIRDAFPVSEGHMLVVPRRLIGTWWEASPDERADLLRLVEVVKAQLDELYAPDGYNIGFNSGEAAGQTISHFHLHVIPRRLGDVEDPRGGIRHVIPLRARWDRMPPLSEEAARVVDERQVARQRAFDLIAGPSRVLHPELVSALADKAFDRVDLVVSFVMWSGLHLLAGSIEDALDRGAQVRVLTTDYLGITERAALGWLLDRSASSEAGTGGLAVRVFSDETLSFHPKAYLFWSSTSDAGIGFVGSSNISRSGLQSGIEWNMRTEELPLLRQGFEHLWRDRRSRTLTEDLLAGIADRARPQHAASGDDAAVGSSATPVPAAAVAEIEADDLERPQPTPIQQEALAALEQTRAAGFSSGLVVMATGLGKTWVAAFDSTRPSFQRVLFLAHREEILRQARDVFRLVRPMASTGMFLASNKDPDADVVFASVQTLVRNLERLDRDAFDYVVVDEFHHAAASSYRKVLDHFLPRFLLGLTATPERLDGADLLALCAGNLTFDLGLVEGIDRGALVPFSYWGVSDVVDFTPIPWRNGRFDPVALASAVETVERAEHAIDEWEKRRQTRTLAFCASTSHADFMAEQFRQRGVRAVAVHSEANSAPRHASIAALEAGELDVVCSVDVFNEGLDVPSVDTVLMLRPTESPVVFLQQLGRGLRRHDGKDNLSVIDFIGNHRSFLMKPRTLLSLGSAGAFTSTASTLDAMTSGDFSLPEGCSVQYELEAVELLRRLAPPSFGDAISEFCHSYSEEEGQRPTATQAYQAQLNPGSLRRVGGWFRFLNAEGLLAEDEKRVLERHHAFLDEVETAAATKSYKLVTLRALLHEGGLVDGLDVGVLSATAQRIVSGDPRLVSDATSKDLPDPAGASPEDFARYWRQWPIAAWLGELKGSPSQWFRLEGDRFGPTFAVDSDDAEPLAAMVAELVEYRLARYLAGKGQTFGPGAEMVCRVSHASGRPIIWLDRRRHPNMPAGTAAFTANDLVYEGDFRKEALNVARLPGERGNALHALLRGWFGPSAGHPGTNHRVVVDLAGGQVALRPFTEPAADAQIGGSATLPLFPTLAVACGAFTEPDRLVHDAVTIELQRSSAASLDRTRAFVAYARGDSMDGGDDPIRHGDPLLLVWARGVDRRDLVGERVLVDYHNGGHSTALKRLASHDGQFQLLSDNPDVAPVTGVREMQVVAALERVLRQEDINSLTTHLGEQHSRASIAVLHGDPDKATNWQVGHVSLPGQAILLVTLDKAEMPDVPYVDHFEGSELLVWSSQTSVGPDSKKGREILDALDTGTQIHLWVRLKKRPGEFTYCGLVVPMSHEGSRPMSVRLRLLTPLEPTVARRLGVLR